MIDRKHGALGKRPANARYRKGMLKMADFFDISKIVVPTIFGHYNRLPALGMLGNEYVGCCVEAGAAHHVMYWCAAAGRPIPQFTDDNVYSDYSAATGYNKLNPFSDQGTDMSAWTQYFKKPGIIDAAGVRHTIVDYVVTVEVGNWDKLMLAMYLFDGAGIGVDLPQSAMTQFDAHQPFTIVAGSPSEGGHYMAGFGRNSKQQAVVGTWGDLQGITKEWYERFNDETNAYISLELLDTKTGLTPENYDKTGLAKALAAIG